MKFSVIVPAYNEEKLLPATLDAILRAAEKFSGSVEMIVVDNMSTDGTAEIARSKMARLVSEETRNIAAVCNKGVEFSRCEVLAFIDADTVVSDQFFRRIAELMLDPKCYGGSVWVSYGQFERKWMKYYSTGWKFWGKVFNMKQGAAQFCRRSAFDAIGGFDETIFMGEDIDFYWRLTRFAKMNGGYLTFIEDLDVVTSTRRFDRMNLWKTLLLTHPVFIWLNRKRGGSWKDWYQNALR